MYVSDSGRVNVHACHVLGQPRSTQRRVKKLPGDEEALRTDVIRFGEPVRQVRVSPDHEPAAYRGLGGEPQACGSVSGGRRG